MDKISIVVPVFNAENTLRKCIESLVLGNHKEELEIILVEDQSTDKSWNMCLELQDEFSQVKAIQNSHNSGPSYTRNRGIEETSGNLLLFVDADDWVSCNYITNLYETYKAYESSLVLCGYKFIANQTGTRKDYLFSDNEEIIILESADRYFKLLDHILLQQLWNKIFDLHIIKNNKLHFDENQSMGEDTQFVLDYLSVSNLRQCVIINKPLYYYIRTEQSLMSQYNKVDITSGAERLNELLDISGRNDPVVLNAYKKAVENNKSSLIYSIVHSNHQKKEMIDLINKVCPGEKAERIYKEYNKTVYKEKLASELVKTKRISIRRKNNLNNIKLTRTISAVKNSLKCMDFTVISQNCIGGVFCHDMGLELSSPTVNLFFMADDFVKFVSKLEFYMSIPLCIHWGETYPIGTLDDISIHFMHYQTCKDAVESWERRKQRMNYSRIVVLCTDRDGFSSETFKEWNKISYPKLLFTANREFINEDSVFFPEYSDEKQVLDLIPERQFYKDGKLMAVVNSLNRDQTECK